MSLLSIKNLCKSYGEQTILKNINLSVNKGDIIGIIGATGSGKSTLLKTINHLDPPTSGEIRFSDQLISHNNMDQFRQKMPLLFPDMTLFKHLSVLQNLTMPQQKLLKRPSSESIRKAKETLQTVGMSEYIDHLPHQLTAIQRQRIAIARCLSLEPEILLIDDPTSLTDTATTSEILSVIKKITSSGITMLIATHRLPFVRDITTRALYLDDHCLYEQGNPIDIFDTPRKPKTKAFLRKQRTWEYVITQRDFDFAHMFGNLDLFCYTHSVPGLTSDKIQIITAELVLKLILPQTGYCGIKLEYSDRLGTFELSVRYSGKKDNLFAKYTNDISASLIKSNAKVVHFEYIDGFNILKVKI